jgi:type IV secretion system protein VirB3
MEEEEIAVHPLFVGLTRPPMIYGVTVTFLVINIGFALAIFVLTTSFTTPLTWACLMHGIGYCCCAYDPHFFDLWMGKLQSISDSKNHGYWGCYSYEPF